MTRVPAEALKAAASQPSTPENMMKVFGAQVNVHASQYSNDICPPTQRASRQPGSQQSAGSCLHVFASTIGCALLRMHAAGDTTRLSATVRHARRAVKPRRLDKGLQ